MKAYSRHTFWLGLVFALALALLAGAPAMAQNADDGDVPPPTVNVTLEKKTPEVVITTIGDRYAVSKQDTVIVGPDGKDVKLIDLAVPCDVQLTYHADKGVNVADLITVKNVSASATKDFTHERPE